MISVILIYLQIGICLSSSESDDESEPIKNKSTSEYILYSFLAMACIVFSGVMSSLTLGLLGVDRLELELKAKNGSTTEKTWAKQVLVIISHHHLVLVTLLLSYTISIQAFPLFLSEIFSKEVDIFISITLVLLFGEILPHVIFIGKNRLELAAKLIPTIKVLIVLFLPLSFPISKLLDKVLGSRPSGFLQNQQLKSFLTLDEDEEKGRQQLEKLQIEVLHSIIDLKKKKLKKILKPFKEFLKISVNKPVDRKVLEKIVKKKKNFAFLYEDKKEDIVGVMNIQELFKLWLGDCIRGSNVKFLKPVFISEKLTVSKAIRALGKAMVAIVVSERHSGNCVKGVFSLEAVFEGLFRTDGVLIDEQVRKISNALIEKLAGTKGRSRPASFYREGLL